MAETHVRGLAAANTGKDNRARGPRGESEPDDGRRTLALGLLGLVGVSLAACKEGDGPEELGTVSSDISEAADYATFRGLTPPTSGDISVFVRGRSAVADGGEGWFIWNAACVAADNDGTILRPTSVSSTAPGRWKRVGADVMNVRWFGANANPGGNCTLAFQAAFDALPASGGAVYVPPPTFDESIAYGDPAYVVGASSGFAVTVTGKSRIYFYGDAAASMIRYGGGAGGGGFCFEADDVRVESLGFKGSFVTWLAVYANALASYGTRRRFTVQKCLIIDTTAECASSSSCGAEVFATQGTFEDISFIGNYLDSTSMSSGGGGTASQRMLVKDNQIKHAPGYAISVQRTSNDDSITDLIIEGNVIEDSNDSAIFIGDVSGDSEGLPIKRVIIVNNVIHRANHNAGIYFAARTTVENLRIAGNIIDLTDVGDFGGTRAGFGVTVLSGNGNDSVKNLLIEQNQLMGSQYGINVGAAVSGGFAIRGNQTFDCANGIVVTTTHALGDSEVEISDNHIVGSYYGMTIAPDGTGGSCDQVARLWGNVIDDTSTYGLLLLPTNGATIHAEAYENTVHAGLGLYFSNPSDITLRLVENNFSGGTALGPYSTDIPADIIAYRNRGFVTEAHGTSAISSGTSVTVTHGLSAGAPLEASQIVITPTGFSTAPTANPGPIWVAYTPGTTTFTVHCLSSPGATLNFAWSIRPTLD